MNFLYRNNALGSHIGSDNLLTNFFNGAKSGLTFLSLLVNGSAGKKHDCVALRCVVLSIPGVVCECVTTSSLSIVVGYPTTGLRRCSCCTSDNLVQRLLWFCLQRGPLVGRTYSACLSSSVWRVLGRRTDIRRVACVCCDTYVPLRISRCVSHFCSCPGILQVPSGPHTTVLP